MTPRLAVAIGAAVLFVLAGFTAMNEATSGEPRQAYLWFGLALAASILTLGLRGRPDPNSL